MWKPFNNIIVGINGWMSVNTLWTLITYYPMEGHSQPGKLRGKWTTSVSVRSSISYITDITGYTNRSLLTLQGAPTDPYWHYRGAHRSLLTLQGTPTGPYWHYSVHPQVLTDIVVCTYSSWLTLQSTTTGPYSHYRVHPQTLTDITEYTHSTLLTLQVTPTVLINITEYTYRSLLTLQGTPHRSLLTLQGYTHRSLLTSQGTPTGP